MSWESIASQEYLSGGVSHQLSATRLLSSPEGSRHPLDGIGGAGSDAPWDWPAGGSRGSLSPPSGRGAYFGGGGGGTGGGRDGAGGRDSGGGRGAGAAGGGRSSCGCGGPGGLLGCVRAARARLHHALARRKVEQGVRLYGQRRQQAAVRKWRSALGALRSRPDRFVLLGYLYQAHMDWGKSRDALEFAHRQLCIAEELDSAPLRADAYLNLARAHERLGALERALAYARQSLYNEAEQRATAGLVHLTVGAVYLELAGFGRALDALQHALRLAAAARDAALQLQVLVALSELFGRLRDADRGAAFAARAYDLSRSPRLGDLDSRHHRAALLQMAAALRRQGELGDAHDYCGEAARLSLAAGDQATYARAVRVLGDIYRKRRDVGRAFRQYECAMAAAAAMGDRVLQMESMDGAARCLEALRAQRRICNCRPLELNTRLLEVAGSVGARLLVRAVRARLARIYAALGDDEQRVHQERAAARLLHDLDLRCGACGGAYGLRADALEALPCAHVLHARCAHRLLLEAERAAGRRRRGDAPPLACPECDRALSARPFLDADGPRYVPYSPDDEDDDDDDDGDVVDDEDDDDDDDVDDDDDDDEDEVAEAEDDRGGGDNDRDDDDDGGRRQQRRDDASDGGRPQQQQQRHRLRRRGGGPPDGGAGPVPAGSPCPGANGRRAAARHATSCV